MRRSLLRLSIPLKRPFVTAGGVVSARELLLLRLEDDDGAVGSWPALRLDANRADERGVGNEGM